MKRFAIAMGILIFTSTSVRSQTPLTTAFTYQGQLKEDNAPAGGTYDLRFRLFDAGNLGNQIGSTTCMDGVSPVDGLFTVDLDFGAAAFGGDARWLEISVRGDTTPANCTVGAYTTLTGRQPLTAVPYAMHAMSGGSGALWSASGSSISNANSGFVGIRRSLAVTGSEYFGIQAPVNAGYGGMYIRTDGVNALPFYGYRTGASGSTAWTYLDGAAGDWRVNVDGDRLTVTDTGEVGIGTITPASALHVVGAENGGTTAALRVVSGSQTLLMDGNEIDSLDAVGLYLNNNVPNKVILANGGGSVGIGTTSPAGRLHVVAENNANATTPAYALYARTEDPQGYAGYFAGSGFFGDGPAMYVAGDTRMAGTLMLSNFGPDLDIPVPAGVKLAVDGKILCEELEVQLSGDWPDYVFEDDYALMPLSEVKAFIEREKHLPGIPSAEEVKRDGVEVGKMQADVLRKVEELTLHMIALDRQMDTLRRENEALRRELDSSRLSK